MTCNTSIILPAKNEAQSLKTLLPQLRQQFPEEEIIVVNDGSSDDTEAICASNEVRVVSHAYSMGNGAAVKAGARAAQGKLLVFMDADGQHTPDDIHRLLEKLENGCDMAVGARTSGSHANMGRGVANAFYNWFASKMTSQQIQDLTSGFRAVKSGKFREFLHLLPNGFSYPTTITMAFFRAGYQVAYIPISANKRIGKSHIRIVKDGVRFLVIIFKVATLYSPLKIFLPASAFFLLSGLGYYVYTFITASRFTNMGVLLMITSILIFLIGLISEQITCLMYRDARAD